MTEAAVQPAPPARPPRTWRPMACWTAGILAVLSVVFCLLVLKPYLEVRSAITDYDNGENGAVIVERLGGPKVAARKLVAYNKLPCMFAGDMEKLFALGLMGFCRSEELHRLMELLKSEDRKIRTVAAVALGETGDQRAVKPLVAALGDPWWQVQVGAVGSLRKMGGDQAVEALIGALGNAPHYGVRQSAAEALGVMRDERVLEPLIAALGDPAPLVRDRAAHSLGLLGDQHAVSALERLLQDGDAGVRSTAAQALKKLSAQEPPK